MADEFYELRNALVLGNYHQVVSEAQQVKPQSKKLEDIQLFNSDRDFIVAKAFIGLQQFDVAAGELRTSTKPALVAVRNLALFHKELSAGRTEVADAHVKDIAALLGDQPPNPALADVAAVACSASLVKRDVAASLRISMTWAAALDAATATRHVLELRALTVDGLLRLNRVEAADKEVQAMKAVDDDAILTILSGVAVAIRQGHAKVDKFREALNGLQEVIGRCCVTVPLLNMQAICYLGQGKATEAERCLLEALAKRSGDPDTIANLAVVSMHLGKPIEVVGRFVAQAKATSGALSQWAKTHDAMENRFQEAAATVGTS